MLNLLLHQLYKTHHQVQAQILLKPLKEIYQDKKQSMKSARNSHINFDKANSLNNDSQFLESIQTSGNMLTSRVINQTRLR